MRRDEGMSVVEVILAVAIFATFATATVGIMVQGFRSNRLGGEETIATQFASQGIEAVKSIKNQNFASLVNSVALGVGKSNGVWVFSGSNNVSDKYTRVIAVADTLRDGSGNIGVGGTVDPLTKTITSTVTWPISGGRTGSVNLTTYLSDWKKAISVALTGGIVIYGDGTTIPKYRTYDRAGNSFSAESSGVGSSSGLTFMMRTSPTKSEAIAGYVNAGGVMQIMCFDGTTWTNEWSVAVGGNGSTRRFDIAYETNSGKVVVLYSRNVATTNELAFRTKLGTTGCGSGSWSAETNLDPIRTTGTVLWVKMASDVRASSNLISAIWADSNSDLSAMVWSGSAWGNEPSAVTEASLEVVAVAQDVDDFDVTYESVSGDVMVVWANSAGANGTNGVRYRTCTGGTANCTWGAVTTPPTFADDATNLDISSNPNSDEIVFASIGNAGSDLQRGYWNGSAWTNGANTDTSCATPLAGTRMVATGWLISGGTTRSVIVYNDSAAMNIGWGVGVGATYTVQTDFTPSPSFNTVQRWYDIQTDPIDKDKLIFTISSSTGSLFAKRLIMTAVPAFTWTNADGGAALETALPQLTTKPFSFVYWRQ